MLSGIFKLVTSNKLYILNSSLITLVILVSLLVSPAFAQNPNGGICDSNAADHGDSQCASHSCLGNVCSPAEAGPTQFIKLILRIINISVGLAFMVMTVMFVWAAIKFITSEGDQKKLASARQTITWAILGIFFMGLAWLILVLIERFTGVGVTNFCIGFNEA